MHYRYLSKKLFGKEKKVNVPNQQPTDTKVLKTVKKAEITNSQRYKLGLKIIK